MRFGTQDAQWTAVTGWLEGTFTKPMILPDGKVTQPTGKAYRIPMATIGHWSKDGRGTAGRAVLPITSHDEHAGRRPSLMLG